MYSIEKGNNDIITNDCNVIKNECTDMIEMSEEMLMNVRKEISNPKTLSMPIAELSTLGVGVSPLIPALRTVTQTTTFNTQNLYMLANKGVNDVLKTAKNGNFWGAFKTSDGASKFAQLQTAGPLTATNTSVMPIDPATIMMAVALYSIEQQLDNIEKMQKRILSFLEIEKESEIEADVETLSKIISTYKFNWNNEHFVYSNHKMVLDIQRTARKNMLHYKKTVVDLMNSRQKIVGQNKINTSLIDFQKKFKYYRLSLYAFSLSSLLEIMLSGNFKEDYILDAKNVIENYSLEYREIFTECSLYLEKMSSKSLETNVIKGIGVASKNVGKFIRNIPFVKEGQVDELLQDSGNRLIENTINAKDSILEKFSTLNNPNTSVFIKNMENAIQIYNHTSQICFDEDKIYLLMD